jgi:hypothetical protein
MPIRYSPGKYNRAAGTRNAFAALSADLEREGYPAMFVNDGDREPQDEIDVFLSRYRPQPTGGGAFNDVRWWQGTRYVRFSPAGTVAVPGTGNHGRRRSNDLAWPYNDASTRAHQRAQVLAKKHNITCEGLAFKEPWHWTFWGALGDVVSTAGTITDRTSEEDDMYDEGKHREVLTASRDILLYKMGTGVVAVGDGGFWPVPNEAYLNLLVAWEIAGPNLVVRPIDQNELTAMLDLKRTLSPTGTGSAEKVEAVLSLTPEDAEQLAAAVGRQPVVLSQSTLAEVAKAAADGARDGGEAGAAAAISGLSFVTTIAG